MMTHEEEMKRAFFGRGAEHDVNPVRPKVMRTVEEVETQLGWTEEEASNCGCNMREEPCHRCWSLGWALGGDDIIKPERPTPSDVA